MALSNANKSPEIKFFQFIKGHDIQFKECQLQQNSNLICIDPRQSHAKDFKMNAFFCFSERVRLPFL